MDITSLETEAHTLGTGCPSGNPSSTISVSFEINGRERAAGYTPGESIRPISGTQ